MKQIFDWLREQMQKRIDRCEVNDTQDIEEGRRMYILGKQGGLEKALELVNEAEAKWEEECKRADFEWRINEVLPMLEEKCLYGTASLIKAMADALGIKISEVE